MPLPDPTALRAEARAERARKAAAAAAEIDRLRAIARAQVPALRADLEAEIRDGIARDKTAGRLDFRFGEVYWVFSKKDPSYVAAEPVYEAMIHAFVAEVRKRGGYRISAQKRDFESSVLSELLGAERVQGTAWDITVRWKV
jgi:hypothetical protein